MGKNDKKPEPPPQPRPCGACSGKGWDHPADRRCAAAAAVHRLQRKGNSLTEQAKIKFWRSKVEEALELSESDAPAPDTEMPKILPVYSGRAMYGESCFGIAFGYSDQVNSFLVALGALEVDNAWQAEDGSFDVWLSDLDALQLAQRMKLDQMGHGIVAYFPGVELV